MKINLRGIIKYFAVVMCLTCSLWTSACAEDKNKVEKVSSSNYSEDSNISSQGESEESSKTTTVVTATAKPKTTTSATAAKTTTSTTTTSITTTTVKTTSTTPKPTTTTTKATTTAVVTTTVKPVTTTPAPVVTTVTTTTAPNFESYKNDVLNLVNAQRQNAGLASLEMNATLNAMAQVRAQEISELFSHTRPNGGDLSSVFSEYNVQWWAIGENIAAGYQTSAEVMDGWMNSPGHKSNILSDQFCQIGIGVCRIGGTMYWVQIFANLA